MFKKPVFLLLILLAVVLVFSFKASALSQSPTKPSLEISNQEVEFIINKGDGLREISRNLVAQKIIYNALFFKFYTVISGNAQSFKPGIYHFDPNTSSAKLVNLFSAKSPLINVVIKEGETMLDIESNLIAAKVLNKSPGSTQNPRSTFSTLKPAEFAPDFPFLKNINSFEGFLFPDTYHFAFDMKAEDVLKIMLNNFQVKAWPMLKSHRNYYQLLKIASLIEKEATGDNDRALISGLIAKRLSLPMALQIDSAIAYAECGKRFTSCDDKLRVVTEADLKFESPYNNYKNLGLPPTPITNPGLSAINAALHPKASNYLYYLSEPTTGKTIFSTTLDEHGTNRVKYLINTNQ